MPYELYDEITGDVHELDSENLADAESEGLKRSNFSVRFIEPEEVEEEIDETLKIKEISIWLWADKERNWDKANDLGMTDAQIKKYKIAYLGYEIELIFVYDNLTDKFILYEIDPHDGRDEIFIPTSRGE